MLKFILLPVALVGGLFAAMSAHVMGTSVLRQLSWAPTTATVVEAAHLCALTYQPQDAVLRETAAVAACDAIEATPLPAGGSKPRVFEGEYGSLVYNAAGAAMEWRGKLSDAGVYNASAGQMLPLLYDPGDPKRLDTPAMKGWLGGSLIMLFGGGFAIFYLWQFWLRRR